MKAVAPIALTLVTSCVASAEWKPAGDGLRTRWAATVSPDAVWAEYPRPQLVREGWVNLNGLWDYAVTTRQAGAVTAWAGRILVPFCPESALSGVGRLIEPTETLWYRRNLPAPVPGKRAILHFEAVDHEATILVNGTEVGSHRGGHTPFSFDITPALREGGNELVVRVEDATEGFQLHGKQKLQPGGIWYTRVTGIWQTVWLEHIPERFIRDLEVKSDIGTGRMRVTAEVPGKAPPGERVRVTAFLDGRQVATAEGRGGATIPVPGAMPWSPEAPHLYELRVELRGPGGAVVDAVDSYTAFREFGKARDAGGNWRFTLNGEPLFHWGPLDQGWWPDGLLTPPSDEAMRSDIEFLKAAGFNMIRKHIKVEPRRYYHHCDRIGMLVWQDQVSRGYGTRTPPPGSNPKWTRLAPDPQDGRWPAAEHGQFVTEYKRMVDTLRDHPCIAVWVPFNEAWGQHRTMEVGRMAVDYDRTRHVNIASGGNFWPVGDVADHHSYPNPAFPVDDGRFDDYVKVVGEFGGHGWPVDGHLWKQDQRNWGYGGLPESLDEWKERYRRSIAMLCSLRKRGVAGGVYTQTTDVEAEINGLLTYDRVRKVDPAWLKAQAEILLDTPDAVRTAVVLPTSEDDPQEWAFTTGAPGEGWEQPAFDDAAWKRGRGGFGTRETPGTQVRTEWNTPDIWIRRRFEVDRAPEGALALRIFHDEDAEVFLNGRRILAASGHVTRYTEITVPEGQLNPGPNVLAIHCRQTRGGQYIDAGLVDEIPR